jgi:hypothetical protein
VGWDEGFGHGRIKWAAKYSTSVLYYFKAFLGVVKREKEEGEKVLTIDFAK